VVSEHKFYCPGVESFDFLTERSGLSTAEATEVIREALAALLNSQRG